ncbi:MAG: hypothetical protein HY328_07050 [Chloroflexi bacterium]|nr:hypothetical protein [Chloroflexota bacterium]
MSQTVVLNLPDETIVRYAWGAAAARKPLEEFLADRLNEAAPVLVDLHTRPFDADLDELNRVSDDNLWSIARQRLSDSEQEQYDVLLEKNQLAVLPPHEQAVLQRLGNRARHLTLRKAHAFMILKWRGYKLPSPDEMQEDE